MLPSIIDSIAGKSNENYIPRSALMNLTPPAVLRPRGKTTSGTPPEHRRQFVRGAKIPMAGILGRMLVGGTIIHAAGEGGWLHLVFALAGHKYAGRPVISDCPYFLRDESKFDLDKKTTAAGAYYSYKNNHLSVNVYDGAQTTIEHLPTLKHAPGWAEDMVGNGIVLAHLSLYDHSGFYPNGLPEFSFLLDACEGGDPLSSDVILRYLRHDLETTDDEIDMESFDHARAICAEPVVTAVGANEHRYTCGGAYDFNESHADVLERLLQTCGGKLVYQSGKFSLYVAASAGNPDIEIQESDIIGDVEVAPMPERRDLANIVTGTYTDALGNYQTADFPEVTSERFINEDGEELESDFDLELVQTCDQAQRLASLEMNRNRLLVAKVPCNFRAFSARVGRPVKLNAPSIGLVRNFLVEGWEFNALKGVTLTLREDFPELWGDYIGAVPNRPPPTDIPGADDIEPPHSASFSEFEQFGEWVCQLEWQHNRPGSVLRYSVTVDKMIKNGEEWSAEQVANDETKSTRFIFRVPSVGEFRALITAENNYGVISEPLEFWYTSTIPTIEITDINADVDVSTYPARGLLSWDVDRLENFDPGSVVFVVEYREGGTDDWLPVATTSATSCWIDGLANGRHDIRVNGSPPYGSPTGWRVGQFTVESVTVPDDLSVTTTGADSATAGVLSWSGAGVAWDIEMRKNGTLWAGGSVTSREWTIPAAEPGIYLLRVRARSGPAVSDFAQLEWSGAELPAPKAVTVTVTPDNAASSATVSWQSGGCVQFTSGYELQLIDSDGHIDLRTVTQSTEYLLPVLIPGRYSVKLRAISLSGDYFSPWAEGGMSIAGLSPPGDLTVIESVVGTGATLQQSITASWRSGDDLAQSYDLEYRLLSSEFWTGGYSGAATGATLSGLGPGDYYFRVRSRLAGRSSNYTQALVKIRGLERVPDNVENAQLRALSSSVAMLTWDMMTDPTVISGGSINVRHTHLTGVGATWEAAVPLTDRLPGNATLTNVPLLSGTYLIKAVNAFNKWSKIAAVVVSNMGNMLGYNRVVEREEPSEWPGEKHNATVDPGGSLTLGGGDRPYYAMCKPLDLKSVFTVRLFLEVDGSAYVPDMIDSRVDRIDSWSMFDGKDPGNTSLSYEVSQTDDDPNERSAKWSDWTQFLVGEFRARAFRLRVSLVTDNPDAVGTLAKLKLIADVPDRNERGLGINSPATGCRVNYNRAFLAPAAISITGQGMKAGDRYEITNSDNSGFNIQFFDNEGAGIERQFDYFAISYGEQ